MEKTTTKRNKTKETTQGATEKQPASKEMESIIYSQEGKEVGKIKLPEDVFGVSWNGDMVHQVVESMKSNARKPYAHTKNRGEVRGGGKKPWQQKGLGRARHGSIRSPIWVGGGVAHGPRNEENFERKINKKMKTKALFTVLSRKLKDSEIIFIDSISFPKPKTKDAKLALDSIAKIKGFERVQTKKKNVAVIASATKDKNVEKSFSNIGSVVVEEARNLNPVGLLQYKYLIVTDPKSFLKIMEAKTAK